MKGIVLAEHLQKYIAVAERFTGKNITLPILGNILIEFLDQKIRLTATNLEIACVLNIPAKISKEGSITVPARAFSSYLQTLPPDDKVVLEEKEGVLYIETNSVKSKVLTIPPKDFPLIPNIKKEKGIRLPVVEFQQGLQAVVSAVSTSQIKPELNGVFISYNSKDTIVTCAATDSFRLAEKKIFTSKNEHSDFSFILPVRSVQEIIHFQSQEKEVECVFGDSQIKLIFGDHEIISNTTTGTFPNYSGIIPKSFETLITVKKDEFIDAVRSTSFFSSKLQDVHVKVESNNTVEVHAENNEVGETTIAVKGVIQGKPGYISFNYKFLLDGLQPVTGNEVLISMNNESSPALIKSSDNSAYIYLIMPLKNI